MSTKAQQKPLTQKHIEDLMSQIERAISENPVPIVWSTNQTFTFTGEVCLTRLIVPKAATANFGPSFLVSAGFVDGEETPFCEFQKLQAIITAIHLNFMGIHDEHKLNISQTHELLPDQKYIDVFELMGIRFKGTLTYRGWLQEKGASQNYYKIPVIPVKALAVDKELRDKILKENRSWKFEPALNAFANQGRFVKIARYARGGGTVISKDHIVKDPVTGRASRQALTYYLENPSPLAPPRDKEELLQPPFKDLGTATYKSMVSGFICPSFIATSGSAMGTIKLVCTRLHHYREAENCEAAIDNAARAAGIERIEIEDEVEAPRRRPEPVVVTKYEPIQGDDVCGEFE